MTEDRKKNTPNQEAFIHPEELLLHSRFLFEEEEEETPEEESQEQQKELPVQKGESEETEGIEYVLELEKIQEETYYQKVKKELADYLKYRQNYVENLRKKQTRSHTPFLLSKKPDPGSGKKAKTGLQQQKRTVKSQKTDLFSEKPAAKKEKQQLKPQVKSNKPLKKEGLNLEFQDNKKKTRPEMKKTLSPKPTIKKQIKPETKKKTDIFKSDKPVKPDNLSGFNRQQKTNLNTHRTKKKLNDDFTVRFYEKSAVISRKDSFAIRKTRITTNKSYTQEKEKISSSKSKKDSLMGDFEQKSSMSASFIEDLKTGFKV